MDKLGLEQINDTDLWAAFQSGSRKAFIVIYEKYIRVLYEYGSKLSPNHELVEDCIQELYIDLWLKKDQLGSTHNIKAYLFTSLKRRLTRQLSRISQQKQKIEENYGVEFALEVSQETKMLEELQEKHWKNRLNEALQGLTPRQREFIFLKYYQKLSYDEVARVMDLKKKGVYKLADRAIKALKSSVLVTTVILLLLTVWEVFTS
ncbi:sigma-70 family RNA polymerase sigma factor [Rapidithrix thailandica]|uniref:Sigma-70 family RNA polymerase sigma factor n=1 Tax=Rapidithrix thailandica TaxID=413964 RepID=A0AAW9RYW7_9BACT